MSNPSFLAINDMHLHSFCGRCSKARKEPGAIFHYWPLVKYGVSNIRIGIGEQGVGPNWVDNCPVSGVRGGCCVFRPAVQVQDNWGYCSGKTPAGGTFLDDQCNLARTGQGYNSELSSRGPWTEFRSQVVVGP